MHVILETERMVLRRFTADDAELIFELDNDPEVMRYINGGEPSDRSEAIEAVDRWLEYYERGDVFGFWAAIERANGGFVGWFHYRPRPDGSVPDPELGYRLVRAVWGRGLATEGARALIDRGFERLGVDRVYATTMAVNSASRRVMEKVGMGLIRTFHEEWPVRIAGDEYGDVEYAVTRAQWRDDRRHR